MGKEKCEIAFLRAYQRSGTNWVGNLLNLHPEITCKGEFHWERIFFAFNHTKNDNFGLMSEDSKILNQEFFRFVERTIKRYCKHAPVCVERTPLRISDAFFPNRKYIFITRDGKDILVSWCYHLLRMQMRKGAYWNKKNSLFEKNPLYFEENKHLLLDNEEFVRKNAKDWNDCIVKDFKWLKFSDLGKRKFKYYWVKYEDLVGDTEKYRKEIYSFLEVEPNKAEPLNDITVAGFKRDQKVNTKSHYRKGKAGAWREYFTDEQLRWFNEEAGEALELLQLKVAHKL